MRNENCESGPLCVSSRPLFGKSNIWVPAAIVLIYALTRWPNLMPLNFSLAYGLAFCAGAFPRLLKWWLVFSAFVLTDVLLNEFYYDTPLFTDYQMLIYGSFALVYLLGRQFGSKGSIWRFVGGGILGALVFYLVTNTAAWLWNPVYAKTISGWLQALSLGEPGWPHTWTFFRNTLISGGLFSGLITAAMRAVQVEAPETDEAEEVESAEETEPEKESAKA